MTKTKTQSGIDLSLAKALSHPLRVQILTILHKRVASPNQIAQQLGEGLSQVSYHVKVLEEYKCIELVDTKPRRGAVEHFYRAITAPFLTDSDFESLSAEAKEELSVVSVQMVLRDAVEALEAGTFNSRGDRHFSRTALVVDEEGWKDIASLLLGTLDRILDIQVDSASRLAQAGGKEIHAKVDILHFESPDPEPARDDSTGG